MRKRPVQIEDLLRLQIPSGIQLAPDGAAVFWSQRSVDPAVCRTVSHLHRGAAGSTADALTSGPVVDVAVRLSPDGAQIAFVRRPVGDPDRARAAALCVVPAAGGPVRVLAAADGDFGAPAWSPDGARLVVAFRAADPLPDGEREPRAIRVTRLHYKEDGAGYLPRDRHHLYAIDVATARPGDRLAPLTDPDGDWDDTHPTFSPDGASIAFLSNRRPDRDLDPEARDLWVVPAAGGAARCTTAERGVLLPPAWGADGTWLAVPACFGPRGSALARRNVRLYRVPLDGGSALCLTPQLDRSTMNLTIDDLWGLEHWLHPPALAAGGAAVLVPVSDRGRTYLAAVGVDPGGRPTGRIDRVVDCVVDFDARCGRDEVAAITSAPGEPGRVEIHEVAPAGRGRVTEVAWPLGAYCAEVEIPRPLEIEVESSEGAQVHGFLLLPPGDGPFPLLLDIHGGPSVQFGGGFFHELACWVSQGWAVLYVNPRGSQGYGEAFAAAIHQDWGTRPMADVMACLDHVLARWPIDAARLGVLGGSYGGYLTTWVIAHTDRFRAACAERTLSSMEAMLWCDFGSTVGDELGAQPWEDPDMYRRMSPITYADQIATPLLITQGLADQRTPPDQGERLFVALRLRGKPCELILFPGCTHDLSRSGPPPQRVERIVAIRDWFARHLGRAE